MAILSPTNIIELTDYLGSAFITELGDYVKYGAGSNVQPFLYVAGFPPGSNGTNTNPNTPGNELVANTGDVQLFGTVINTLPGANSTATRCITGTSTKFLSSTLYPIKAGMILKVYNGSNNYYMRVVNVIDDTHLTIDTLTMPNGTVIPALYNGGSGYNVYLARDWGANAWARWLEAYTLNIVDYSLVNTMLSPIHTIQNTAPIQKVSASEFSQSIAGINASCIAASLTGVTDINTFAQYYNLGTGGGPTPSPYNGAMFSPDFAQCYLRTQNVALLPQNVYAPYVDNMGSITITTGTGGSFTSSGFYIDPSTYGGAAILQFTLVGGNLTTAGTGTITVTATARTAANQSFTTIGGGTVSQTWTYSTGSTLTAGTYNLTPTVAGNLALQVTGISISGWSGGSSTSLFVTNTIPTTPFTRNFPAQLQSA